MFVLLILNTQMNYKSRLAFKCFYTTRIKKSSNYINLPNAISNFVRLAFKVCFKNGSAKSVYYVNSKYLEYFNELENPRYS